MNPPEEQIVDAFRWLVTTCYRQPAAGSAIRDGA